MKILLANLPWKKGRAWGVRAGSRWPHIKTPQERDYCPFPFFLAYAAALLKREDFEVCLIDALAEKIPEDRFLKMVSRENPDLMVAETSTPSLDSDLDILKKLPRGVPVALCGPEANMRETRFLQEHRRIAYVLIGEYEMTLLELARHLQQGRPLDHVSGLMHRSGAEIKTNSMRPLIEDLDMLPWPLRDGLPMDRYNDRPGGIPSPSAQMWTSRGCPYRCIFCAWPQLMYRENRYRVRSVVDVVGEMEHLVFQRGFKSVYFDDDTTNIGRLRMMEFAREIKARGLRVPWAMMARADLMDEQILESLRSAGLHAVKYGVESAVQGLLDSSQKGMDIHKTQEMIRYTKVLGIKTHLTFTFGLPGETRETIRRTMDFALQLDPDSLQFSITTPFPGTRYFCELEQKGYILSRDFSEYDGHAKSILRTETLSPRELQKSKRRAESVWRNHLRWTRKWRPALLRYAGRFFGNQDRRRRFLSSFSKTISILYRYGGQGRSRLKKKFGAARREFGKFRGLLGRYGARTAVKKLKARYLDILGVYHGSLAFKGPSCVQIDVTNNCNNNCIGCWCNSPLLGEDAYRGSRKYMTLPTLLLQNLIDELSEMGTQELYFSGGGEPFMHPDLLFLLRYAKQKRLRCSVNTNFTLIDESMVKQLIDMDLDGLTVSVWAGTPQTYAATHPNKDEATFFKIRDRLRMLNALKKDGKPFVKIYHVLSTLNHQEIRPMVDFANDTKSEAVEFTVIDTIPGATEALMLSGDQRRRVLQECEKLKGSANGVRFLNLEHFMRRLADAGAGCAQYDSEFVEKMPCVIGWLFSRIMPNGDVNFCLKAHRIPVGNLYESSFKEIWNSSRQIECRRKALLAPKDDPFFRMIGNDPACQIGCYKSCDDLGRIVGMHDRMQALSGPQRWALKSLARLMR